MTDDSKLRIEKLNLGHVTEGMTEEMIEIEVAEMTGVIMTKEEETMMTEEEILMIGEEIMMIGEEILMKGEEESLIEEGNHNHTGRDHDC